MENDLKNMKKVILHIHLDGSLRPETVQEWLEEDAKHYSLEEVQKKLIVDENCQNLNEYLEKFDLPLELLQDSGRIERATFELFEDLSKQNVIYSEVRFAPCLHVKKGLNYNQIVEAAINGMNKAKEKYNIDGNLLLCCMRGNDNETELLRTVKVAKDYLNKGVCGLDLAGAEALFPTQDYEEIFKIARKNNIPFTIHAGEAAGADSIKKALDFGAKRIGHGVRCIENEKVMQELIDKGILLEVCPISNIQTQAIHGDHPLEKLYRRGILTSINTDNNTVSNTDIEKEYRWVLENTELTYSDLVQMNINAARAIFDTPQKKANLIAQISEQNKEFQENRSI